MISIKFGVTAKNGIQMASLTKEISVATKQGKDTDKKIEALKSALSATEKKKTGDLSAQFSQMIEQLEFVTAFTSALEKITHLQDVDEICGESLCYCT